jgi:hypothetical protein
MKIDNLDLENIRTRFEMCPELVGNFMRGRLHSGLIYPVFDVTGGILA